MKRTLVVGIAALLCLAAAPHAVVRYRLAAESARRHQYSQAERYTEDHTPLALDTKTQAILSGADRVETFRLDGGGDEKLTSAEETALHGSHPQYLDEYAVMDVGQVQGKAFAASLQKALSQVPGVGDSSQCFEPGVGFRAWRGKAHIDVCVCFYCSGIQIISPGASPESIRRNSNDQTVMLGRSRPALLALSKEAFPQDTRLAALN